MIIKVKKDLKSMDILANGVELASVMGMDRQKGKRVITYPQNKTMYVTSFKNPVLMTDNYKIGKLNPAMRDTLFSLYNSRPRIVEYDGVSTYWDDSHTNVWCPSIDTILFAKGLNKILSKHKNIKTAVEIGCGSGFISKYLLKKNKKLKSILINDINPYAIKSAMDNIKDSRAIYYQGNGIKKIKGEKYDLIICNPPYVPRPNSIDDNPYEGVGVLNYLIHHGHKHLNDGGLLLTNISNLCHDIVLKEKPQMKMQSIEKMRVPLKVNNILNNKAWLNYLIKKRDLIKNHRAGYDYWQDINITAFYK